MQPHKIVPLDVLQQLSEGASVRFLAYFNSYNAENALVNVSYGDCAIMIDTTFLELKDMKQGELYEWMGRIKHSEIAQSPIPFYVQALIYRSAESLELDLYERVLAAKHNFLALDGSKCE